MMCYIFLISVKLTIDLCTYQSMIFSKEPVVKLLPAHHEAGWHQHVTALCPSDVRRPNLSRIISLVDKTKQIKMEQ